MFWVRQALALIIGCAAGVLQLQGLPIIIGGMCGIYFLSTMYAKNVLQLDNDDYPNNELSTEGMANSMGMFMVSAPTLTLATVAATLRFY